MEDKNIDERESGVADATPTPKSKRGTKEDPSVLKANQAMDNALATAALETTLKAQNTIAKMDADRAYIIAKKQHMLNKCKEDEVMTFVGDKLYAQYFGKTYTFLYNTIPVTIVFDGSKQKFPKFIYEFIIKKIAEVSDSNTNKDITYEL